MRRECRKLAVSAARPALVTCLLFLAGTIAYGQSDKLKKQIEQAASKCSAGDVKSCGKLAVIAKTDKGVFAQQAAILKITDQTVLLDIFKTDPHWIPRCAALGRIADQSIRVAAARNSSSKEVTVEGSVMRLQGTGGGWEAFRAAPGPGNLFVVSLGDFSLGGTHYSGRGKVFIFATTGEHDPMEDRISNVIVADIDASHDNIVSIATER
jgi:hypothetical protein